MKDMDIVFPQMPLLAKWFTQRDFLSSNPLFIFRLWFLKRNPLMILFRNVHNLAPQSTIQLGEIQFFSICELTFWAQRCDQVSKLR